MKERGQAPFLTCEIFMLERPKANHSTLITSKVRKGACPRCFG